MTDTKILYHYLLDYIEADKIENLSDTERLALIASIVKNGPFNETWNALIELFYAWKWDHKHEAITYTNNLITDWPLVVRTVNMAWARVFNNGYLTDVILLAKGIDINRSTNGNDLTVVASSPFAVNLIEISIDRSSVSLEGMLALSGSKFLRHLVILNLNGITLSDEKLEILFNPTALDGLKILKLKNCGINIERTKLLAKSKLLTQLKGLNLSYNTIGNEGVNVLFNSTLLPDLEQLDLTDNFISDEGAVLLLKCDKLPNLIELTLSRNNINKPEVLYALAAKKNNLKLIL
ncbi:hypothetical protein [Pedobacter sp. UBA5917]|jgi:hypothetical protein|uniref:hypothetical protein n=1 Tax=Pedobacter sp. UBA5917 TaxID=1947061 RepID=UPI0025F852A6|nr:hypothetical protein [Pedobacter sp. UBA5917]